ncbi:hypothetical protein [Synechococcus sp. MW101C3]|uniref:hypothetical protein n=1 Tax=Synechococcus sp. MW101C3 TaxID=210768 RepID=UPI001303CA38|nr:hypothetical protein [Synechococcus sp. MW101C3]
MAKVLARESARQCPAQRWESEISKLQGEVSRRQLVGFGQMLLINEATEFF